MNFIQFLQENISHVLPVLIAGAFGLTIIIERSRALFFNFPLKNSVAFFKTLQEHVLGGRLQDATRLCEEQGDKPAAHIVKAGLGRAELPMEAIEQGLELAVAEQSQRIQKRTSFLATIANVATLLGLFGTIAGLIYSFEAVGHADPQQKSALLSAGIATAMNATMMGLAVAIPCMIAYAFLVNQSNRLIANLEEASRRVVDTLKLRYYGADMRPAQNHGNGRELRRVA